MKVFFKYQSNYYLSRITGRLWKILLTLAAFPKIVLTFFLASCYSFVKSAISYKLIVLISGKKLPWIKKL